MERRYLPFELKQIFSQVGLRVLNIWGGTVHISLDAFEVMVVAVKE